MLLPQIVALQADLLALVLRVVIVRQDPLRQNEYQVIDPPIVLAIKPF